MLRLDDYRSQFVHLDGLSAVFSALETRANFQIQYQLIFCVWICTFDYDLTLRMSRYNAIPKLADILSESIKEKVIRMILATFRVSFVTLTFVFTVWNDANLLYLNSMREQILI